MRPHRRQPTRLPRPWDSPGKNTGVGCHFLLQCRKVKSESEVPQSCPTLSDPMDCSPPGSSVHGIFQARVLEWGAIAFSEQPTEESLKITVASPTSMNLYEPLLRFPRGRSSFFWQTLEYLDNSVCVNTTLATRRGILETSETETWGGCELLCVSQKTVPKGSDVTIRAGRVWTDDPGSRWRWGLV